MASLRERVAVGFRAVGLSAVMRGSLDRLLRPHVRAVNYHDVPPERASAFEAQLEAYRGRYADVDLASLLALLRDGSWPHPRPGLLLSFDDGLRSHAEVVAPLLERHGFTGWFMVPVGFVEAPPEEQLAFAENRQIQVEDAWSDGRVAMSWSDLRRLDRAGHVIACHSYDHRRLTAALTPDELRHEIPEAKERLEEGLGHEVPVFAWVGGEEESYSAGAARAIRDAGFELSFMTNNAVIRPGDDPLQLQRSNIEAAFPEPLVDLTLSGFYDLLYLGKRRRVNQLTSPSPG